MKIVSSLKSRKKGRGNQLVRRKGRIYVINKKNPKAKARQGGWILLPLLFGGEFFWYSEIEYWCLRLCECINV